MSRLHLRMGAALSGACLVALLARCGQSTSSPPTTASTQAGAESITHAEGYVGRARCAECHAAEAEAYQGSHHDLAMQEVNEQTVLGDFDDASYRHFETTAEFRREGERFVVRTQDAAGELRDFELRYVFGVTPLQQYLVEMDGGRLQVLPFCWDSRPKTEGGQRWYHLYGDEPIPPGDALHWTGREQNWNSMCAECHSTGLTRGYDIETDHFHTRYSELDVSCESCHGPGQDHVQWAESGRRGEAPFGLRIDLADRSGGFWDLAPDARTRHRTAPPQPDAMIDACAPCHSRRRPLTDGYEPSASLLDSHHLERIRDPLYFPDGQIRDEVYVHGSFLQSKMHAAGVRCSDCHDPHSLQLVAKGNALCVRCHDADSFDTPAHHFHPAGSEATSCVTCHMPTRVYMGVDERHDHSFRVPRPDLAQFTGAPDVCTSCHQDQSHEWATQAITDARGGDTTWQKPHFGPLFAAAWSGAPQAHEALAQLALDPSWPGMVRASALDALAEASLQLRLPAANQALGDSDPLVRLAAVGCLQDVEPSIRSQVLEALRNDPSRAVRAEVQRMLGSEPAPELEESFGAAAERPETWLNRGLFELNRGQLDAAEVAYRKALQMEPGFVGAAVNLADLLRSRQREEEGREVLEQLLGHQPQAAAVHHSLGLLLVRTGERDLALQHLEKAARFAPQDPRFSFVYAVALQDAGQADAAVRSLQAAVALHPTDFDLRSFLATLLLQLGETEQALLQAQELKQWYPSNRRVDQLLQAINEAR